MPPGAYRPAVRHREDETSDVVRYRDFFTVNEGMVVSAQQDGVRKAGFPARFPWQGVNISQSRNRP